jgi:putative ABC transport system permease protein
MSVESVRIAFRGIAANPLRSALTVLGITIGVAAVIVLVAVGRGSAASVQEQIQGLGTNVITVFPGGGGRFGAFGGARTGTSSVSSELTLKDVEALRDKELAPDIKSVSPIVNAQGATIAFGAASYQPAQMTGSTPSLAEARNYEVAAGRFITAEDEKAHERVVVLGQTVVFNVFGVQNPIDQIVRINGTSFRVIGVLEAKGTNGSQDQDDIAIAPLSAVQDTLAGGNAVNSIVVQATSAETVDEAQSEANAILLSSHADSNGNPTFRILNQASLLQASNESNRTFTVLLGAVAAISLLVGGIGVMNIMLVSVTERTREIGIRKAIGARRSDIVGQFLAESVLLSIFGGLVGVVCGLVGSRFEIVGVQPVVELYAIVLAFGVAVGVGLFFGIYPANRAAALRPIEALRYE